MSLLFEGINRNSHPFNPENDLYLRTIRAFDPKIRQEIHERIRKTATMIAESGGANAEVSIQPGAPVVFNNLAVTQKAFLTLEEFPVQGICLPHSKGRPLRTLLTIRKKFPGYSSMWELLRRVRKVFRAILRIFLWMKKASSWEFEPW